jgi:hypothetical protein
MKTAITFLLILVLALGSFAQSSLKSDQKSGTASSIINPETQSFSISKIYPNPVKDIVTVELRSTEAGSLQASLINILGTEVKKWDSQIISKGDQKLKLDLSFLHTGVYFLKISISGKVVTQVLKKN